MIVFALQEENSTRAKATLPSQHGLAKLSPSRADKFSAQYGH
jgi:hypothetical protein